MCLGISQLGKLEKMVAIRSDLVSIYNKNITKISAHVHPPEPVQTTKKVGWHLYCPQIDFASLGIKRSGNYKNLKKKVLGPKSTINLLIPNHITENYCIIKNSPEPNNISKVHSRYPFILKCLKMMWKGF